MSHIFYAKFYTSGAFTHRTWNLIHPDSITTSRRSPVVCDPTASNFSLQKHTALVTPATSHETGVTVLCNPTTTAIGKLLEEFSSSPTRTHVPPSDGAPVCSTQPGHIQQCLIRSGQATRLPAAQSMQSRCLIRAAGHEVPLKPLSLSSGPPPVIYIFGDQKCLILCAPPSSCAEAKWSYFCVRHCVHHQQRSETWLHEDGGMYMADSPRRCGKQSYNGFELRRIGTDKFPSW